VSEVKGLVFRALLLVVDSGVVLQPKVATAGVRCDRKHLIEYLEVSPVSESKTRCPMLTNVACNLPQPPLWCTRKEDSLPVGSKPTK
jgi:hypothetical protein